MSCRVFDSKPRVKRAPLRRCLQKEDDDDKKTCGQIALPYANHCLKRILATHQSLSSLMSGGSCRNQG